MPLLANSSTVGLETAVNLTDSLQFHINGKMQLLEHVSLPPYLGGPHLVVKDVLDCSRLEALHSNVI